MASLLTLLIVSVDLISSSTAADWLTQPSFYTHDPNTGQRTHQYATPPPAIVNQPASFQTSGFRHYRSSLQYGRSADNYHRVEQWGPPVRPYGEWRFPYRPYSVPYDQWGAPYAGLNLGLGGFGGYPVPGQPYGYQPPGNNPGNSPDSRGDRYRGGTGFPGQFYPPFPSEPYPSGPGFGYPVPPYADGYYPDDAAMPRMNDREFFRKPTQGRFDWDNR